MAVTIPRQPFGISIPIKHGAGGYFDQTYTVLDQIKSNLINLLLTVKGERRMNTEFGSDLHKLVFEFSNEGLPQIVDSTIRRDIQMWMPYLTIQSVTTDIRTELQDIYTVHITVMFTIDSLGITQAQSVDFSIDQQIL
jgi:phage baseplate assembly protein W